MGEEMDDVDRAYSRLRSKGTISVRQVVHKTTSNSRRRGDFA